MSRSVQVGDLAFVRLGDQETQYTVLAIDGNNIYIGQPGVNTGSLIYYQNGIWRVYGAENIPYVVEFQAATTSPIASTSNFPSDPFVLVQILSQLSNKDLDQACQTNPDVNLVCQGDDLWIMKLQNEFKLSRSDYDENPRELYQRLYRRFDAIYIPTYHQADDASRDGDLPALKYLVSLGVLPEDGANEAAYNGKLEIVEYLASLNPPILPNQLGVDGAAEYGHLDVVQYLASLNPPILPDQDGANWAARNGQLDMVKYLASLTPPILTDQVGANYAAGNGKLEIVKFLASLNPPILPTQGGANGAARYGQLEVVQYLASFNPPIFPNQKGANWAARNGQLEVVQYLASFNPPLLPNQDGANYAAENGKLDMVQYLATLGILPNQEGAEMADENEYTDIVEYLASLNIRRLPIMNAEEVSQWFEQYLRGPDDLLVLFGMFDALSRQSWFATLESYKKDFSDEKITDDLWERLLNVRFFGTYTFNASSSGGGWVYGDDNVTKTFTLQDPTLRDIIHTYKDECAVYQELGAPVRIVDRGSNVYDLLSAFEAGHVEGG